MAPAAHQGARGQPGNAAGDEAAQHVMRGGRAPVGRRREAAREQLRRALVRPEVDRRVGQPVHDRHAVAAPQRARALPPYHLPGGVVLIYVIYIDRAGLPAARTP